MDFHALQQKLFEMDPTDPREDLAKLRGAATGAPTEVAPETDMVTESFDVSPGSLELDKDYSISDFAALAGVVTEGNKSGGKPADQVRGDEPMPKAEPGRTKHPHEKRLVGSIDNDKDAKIAELEERVARLEAALLENKTQNVVETSALKTRQKTTDSIKSDLYARLNRLMDE